MRNFIILGLMLVLPQVASARVYMCVDQTTGETSFTDKACETATSAREEVRVDRTNLDSGSKYGRDGKEKTWRSEEDTRKSGMQYNADRRSLYENKATASSE